jgi:hypothetical protein
LQSMTQSISNRTARNGLCVLRTRCNNMQEGDKEG